MRWVPAIGIALLLVVAGCTGMQPSTPGTTVDTATPGTTTTTPPGTAAPATTGSEASDTSDGSNPNRGIEVEDGELPYDPNRTWARVQRLLGTNVSPPSAVRVVDPGAAGSTSQSGYVYINSKDEAVLAHEFAHSILLRAYDVPPSGSGDEQFARHAAIEGAARYVQTVYERRYLDREPTGFRLPEAPGRAYFLARYYYGHRYYQARVDSAKEIPPLHANPPNTSEQVLHGLAPGSEPPRPLAIRVPTRHLRQNATWFNDGQRRLGEIGLRMTLRTRLGDDEAARGADGWGNDRVVVFTRGGESNFAWVIRWDDPENATEFERVFESFRSTDPPPYAPPSTDQETPYRVFTDRVWTPPSPAFELRRIDANTTVVVIGSAEFVESATIIQEGGVVEVSVGGDG